MTTALCKVLSGKQNYSCSSKVLGILPFAFLGKFYNQLVKVNRKKWWDLD